jgi:tetratricopeptide (TPR) repeat protein
MRLSAERENLLAVFRRNVYDNPEMAARAALCLLGIHGSQQTHVSEFSALYDQLPDLESRIRVRLLTHRAGALALLGQTDQATTDFDAALEQARFLKDQDLVADVQWQLGAMLGWQGEVDAATRHLKDALAHYLESRNRTGEACARYQLSNLYKVTSEGELARRHIRLALTAARKVGARFQEALILHVFGCIERATDPDLAESYLKTALSIVRTYEDRAAEGRVRSDLGRVYQETGQHTEALEQFSESIRLLTEVGHHAVLAHPLTFLGALHHEAGDHKQARLLYRQAMDITVESGQRVGQGLLCGYLALLSHELRRFQEAESNYRTAIYLLQESGGHALLPFFIAALAGLLADTGELTQAEELQSRAQSLKASARAPIAAVVEVMEVQLAFGRAQAEGQAPPEEMLKQIKAQTAALATESKDLRLALRLLEACVASQ